MEKLDDESAAKFITALTKSVQTLCHGFLNFHNGIEIVGYINLNVDKGSNLHYVLEEKVCKNEENSTLFISNSFRAQSQKNDSKTSENVPSDSETLQRTNSTDMGSTGKLSSAISSISSALSRTIEKSRTGSTSSARETDSHSKPVSNTAKRKASDDYSEVRSAKSSHVSSSPSPVGHFLPHSSPHGLPGQTSPVDSKAALRELRGEDLSGMVLPQTAGISGDGGDLGVNLAGSVLERVDDHSNSDLADRGDDSDNDLEVTFIKEEYVEGEQSSCQFENSSGQQQQYGRGTHQRASSSDNLPDTSMYGLHPSASATYVPSAQDLAAQHYGPSTSSQLQPGTPGVRGRVLSGPADLPSDLPSDLDLDYSAVLAAAGCSPGASSSSATSPRGRTEPGPRPRAPRRSKPGTPSGHLPCDQCGAAFATSRGLKLHRDFAHFNKAPYSCPICGRGFTMRGHYVGHMNMHNKVKAFTCSKCPKAFAHRSSLRYHLRNSECGKIDPLPLGKIEPLPLG